MNRIAHAQAQLETTARDLLRELGGTLNVSPGVAGEVAALHGALAMLDSARKPAEPEIREDHHQPLEPAEEAPFCDRCFGYHSHTATCPEDELEEEDEESEFDDDDEERCSNPKGHSWVVRDDNEEISYCEWCGADGNS